MHASCNLVLFFVQVKYQQKYEQEIKGKASTDAGSAEFALAKEHAEHFSQVTQCSYAHSMPLLYILCGYILTYGYTECL